MPQGDDKPTPDRDLPEFDEFLKSIGYGHLQTLPHDTHADETSFVEPVKPLPPACKTTAAPSRSRKAIPIIILALGMLAVCMVVFRAPLKDTLYRLPFMGYGKGFLSSPNFAVERFEQIKPGMTGDAVRDLIGLPLARRPRNVPEIEAWYYTAPLDIRQHKFPLYVVTFENGVVIAARTNTAEPKGNLRYLWATVPIQEVGDLMLARNDGRRRIIRAKRDNPFLLASPTVNLAPSLEAVPGLSTLRVKPVTNLGGRRRAPAPGPLEISKVSWTAEGRSQSVQFPVLGVCAKGILFALPWHSSEVSPERHREDVEWILSRTARHKKPVS